MISLHFLQQPHQASEPSWSLVETARKNHLTVHVNKNIMWVIFWIRAILSENASSNQNTSGSKMFAISIVE